MPQMAPMNWFLLFLFFTLSIMMGVSKLSLINE